MALTRPTWVTNTIQSLANLITGQATAVKQAFDKASSDIKDYTEDLCTEIEEQFASKQELEEAIFNGIAPGTPDYFLHTKTDGSAVEWAPIDFSPIWAQLYELRKNQLLQMLLNTGYNVFHNVYGDSLEDISHINTGASSGYVYDSVSKSLKCQFDSYTKLLMHFNGTDGSTTFLDETGKVVTRYGDAKISTTQYKFGGASGYFDGSGDYLTIPASTDWDFGNSDFTIDFWIYKPSFPVNEVVLMRRTAETSNHAFTIYIDSGAKKVHFVYTTNGSTTIDTTFNTVLAINTWYHLEFVRNGTTIKLYVNGVAEATTISIGTNSIFNSTEVLQIAKSEGTGNYYIGYIEELRISKGIARHTSNFSVPTQEYLPTLTGTVVWNSITSDGTIINAIIEALVSLNSGTAVYYLSRNGGTNYTTCTLDTLTDISSQPTGTSIVLKVVLTSDAELRGIAWGGVTA